MPFIKAASIGTAAGVAVGAAYYVLGNVANVILPTINPTAIAVVGFAGAFAISLLNDMDADTTKT